MNLLSQSNQPPKNKTALKKGGLVGTLERRPTEVWSKSQRSYVWRQRLHFIADDGSQMISETWSSKKEAVQCLRELGWD